MSIAGANLAMANINRSNKSKKKEQAFSLFARGYSHPEISKEISISTRTLSRWRGDYEIQINSCAEIKATDSQIVATVQNATSERINDLLDLALDNLEDILTDQETKKVDKLRAISIVGEWARLGKPIPTDEKTKDEFPFPMEDGKQTVELSKLSEPELRQLYFQNLKET
ncbi:MAG TPA: helix-turn-helix domain-containing protein [Nostoc sp.]|nr:helix-turn-helix domain-containing protein [Nostoc sp.]